MTTSRIIPAWTDISSSDVLSNKALGYFRAQLKNHIHQLVLAELEKSGISKADLARRTHKKPPQIAHLLGAPGNWTLDTLSDLLLGLGYEPAVSVTPINSQNVGSKSPVATSGANIPASTSTAFTYTVISL